VDELETTLVTSGPDRAQGLAPSSARPAEDPRHLAAGWRSSLLRARHGLLSIGAVVAVLLAWQLCAAFGVVPVEFTSSPLRIIASARGYFATPAAWTDLSTSFTEYGIGLGIAIVVSVPLGVCIGWYRTINAIANPFVVFLNSMPLIALAPLFIIWFGLGITSKIALIVVGASVPIVVTTSTGVRTVDENLLKVPRTFQASQFQLLRTLVIPSAVPSILAGIRLATGLGLIVMIVAEIIASTNGIGYMISTAGNTFDTDRLFVGIAIVALAGTLFAWVLRMIERRVERWRL
jgi:ABC-type nitrate/sulfonate/bicarbonate transport system permease component